MFILVFAVQKLKHYMQAYTVQVVLKLFPSNTSCPGQSSVDDLRKWAMILKEHNFVYVPQKVVKGEALADFLADHPIPDE